LLIWLFLHDFRQFWFGEQNSYFAAQDKIKTMARFAKPANGNALCFVLQTMTQNAKHAALHKQTKSYAQKTITCIVL